MFVSIWSVFSPVETGQLYRVGYSTVDSTIVNYTANYPLGSALEAGDELIQIVNASVFEALKNESINGSVIDDEYLDTIASGELIKGKLSLKCLFWHFRIYPCIITSIDQ